MWHFYGVLTFQLNIINNKLWRVYITIPLHDFDTFKVVQWYGYRTIAQLLKYQSCAMLWLYKWPYRYQIKMFGNDMVIYITKALPDALVV